jgi:hypothetical protein
MSYTPPKFPDDEFAVRDNADATKQLNVSLGGATTAKTITLLSSHTDDRTVTLPDETGTLAVSGAAITDFSNVADSDGFDDSTLAPWTADTSAGATVDESSDRLRISTDGVGNDSAFVYKTPQLQDGNPILCHVTMDPAEVEQYLQLTLVDADGRKSGVELRVEVGPTLQISVYNDTSVKTEVIASVVTWITAYVVGGRIHAGYCVDAHGTPPTSGWTWLDPVAVADGLMEMGRSVRIEGGTWNANAVDIDIRDFYELCNTKGLSA